MGAAHGNGLGRRVDAAPFVKWLGDLEDEYDSHSALGRHLGLDQTTVTRFLAAQYETVREIIVDRALTAHGDVHLYREMCPPPVDEEKVTADCGYVESCDQCPFGRCIMEVNRDAATLCEVGIESVERRQETLAGARALRAEARRARTKARKVRAQSQWVRKAVNA